MNDLASIAPSVEILRSSGIPFALLHCTNLYPTPPQFVRLEAVRELAFQRGVELRHYDFRADPEGVAAGLAEWIVQQLSD